MSGDVSTGAGAPSRWIVTGLSGAGKATALAALERRGVHCVDNLPASLLGAAASGDAIAVVVDARQGDAVARLVPPEGWRVLFLDARDDVLVRRAGESTRPHPCADAGGAEAAVRAERDLLAYLRAAADAVVDSSDLTPAQLGDRVVATVAPDRPAQELICTVSSFGFKYRSQPEADWIVDVRFLRNPFWVPELRPLTGLDAEVRDYVMAQPESGELVERLARLLEWTLPHYAEHRRTRLHVALGCTGGRHRSVALAEALAARLGAAGVEVRLRHRDVERPDPR